MMRALGLGMLMFIVVAAVPAADAPKPRVPGNDLPAPPALPEKESPAPPVADLPETGLEPEVTIVTRETEIREEYRVSGRLFKVKVIPKHGKPYFLIDLEGSGVFRRSEMEPGVSVPLWVIKTW